MIKQTGYRNIYTPEGRFNFSDMDLKRSGVYIIRENGKLVYIGFSKTNLYKTLIRHFEAWRPTYGWRVVTYAGKMKRNHYTVKVILLPPAAAAKKEIQLIRRLKPRDNQEKYQADQALSKKTSKSATIKKDVPF